MSESVKIRVAVVGYGNIGRGVIIAVRHSPDMELAGIISRTPDRVRKSLQEPETPVYPMADAENALKEMKADIAVLCGGSKNDLPQQGPLFARFIHTVDSFDNHSRIPEYHASMDSAARENGHVSVISTGWDPGIFSLERTLAEAFLAGARPYGFYGLNPEGGLSMGHSDALRTIPGVLDARQFTHAVHESIDQVRDGRNPEFQPGDMHTRECFVVAEDGADKNRIEEAIRTMPGYFAPYKTSITFISQEELRSRFGGCPHDGCVVASTRTGNEGSQHKASIEYRCSWGSNPEATANVMLAHARAAMRLAADHRSGAFTILDIPPAYFSVRSRDELLKKLM